MITGMVQTLRRLLGSVGFVASVMVISLVGLWYQLSAEPAVLSDSVASRIEADIRHDLDQLAVEINEFESQEAKTGVIVASPEDIDTERSQIRLDLSAGNLKAARSRLNQLKRNLDGWQDSLKVRIAAHNQALSSDPGSPGNVIAAPILIYHQTPNDFEAQLQTLQRKGYTAIDLDQLAGAINGNTPLPAKPVVITFDDGFANQMKAFDLLKKYSMKATYYIITGGERSKWCLGTNRHNELHCGDQYLNWDQVRELDHSGLITIADHTVDHFNLAQLSVDDQRYEIQTAKAELEQQLGHPIHHFAYPYGSFNATTIALVRAAGFTTAVSTLPGSVHSNLTLFTLHRERDVNALP